MNQRPVVRVGCQIRGRTAPRPDPTAGAFAWAVPALVAVWALAGFYLSLGPSLAALLSGSHNLLWGGTVVFLLTGAGAATALAVRNGIDAAPVELSLRQVLTTGEPAAFLVPGV